MNTGYFKGDKYIKLIDINKAVLWKTRQLSVPISVFREIVNKKCKYMIFIDKNRREQWTFEVKKVRKIKEKKMVGQEEQFYFSIDERIKKQDYKEQNERLDGGSITSALAGMPSEQLAKLRAKLQS